VRRKEPSCSVRPDPAVLMEPAYPPSSYDHPADQDDDCSARVRRSRGEAGDEPGELRGLLERHDMTGVERFQAAASDGFCQSHDSMTWNGGVVLADDGKGRCRDDGSIGRDIDLSAERDLAHQRRIRREVRYQRLDLLSGE